MLVVAETYRIDGHSRIDKNVYRTKEEIDTWKKKCPIATLRRYLEGNHLFSTEELEHMEQQAAQNIEKAVEFAQNSPYPSVETILDDVYA
jgi:pyruvate dehydrogenase E1 component alpha subunit